MIQGIRNYLGRKFVKAQFLPFVKVQNKAIEKVIQKYPGFSGYAVLEFNESKESFRFSVKYEENDLILPDEILEYLRIMPTFVSKIIDEIQSVKVTGRTNGVEIFKQFPDVIDKMKEYEEKLGL